MTFREAVQAMEDGDCTQAAGRTFCLHDGQVWVNDDHIIPIGQFAEIYASERFGRSGPAKTQAYLRSP